MKSVGIFAVTLAAAGIFYLSPAIDSSNYSYLRSKSVADLPFYVKFLGEARSIVSNMSILQADLYFHGGAGHFFEEHGGVSITGASAVVKEHIKEDACGHDEHDHVHVGENPVAVVTRGLNVLLWISDGIQINEHIHLGRDKVKEMLPWLFFATKLDPHNIEAYVLTGYWLADRMGKVSEGIDFLRDGLKNNPNSWEIRAELGRISFQYLKNYELAQRLLVRAKENIDKIEHDKFQARYVLSFLANSYEALGRKKDAADIYARLAQDFPQCEWYPQKISELNK